MTRSTLRRMCRLYQAFLDANKLPQMSADELICEDITDAQRVWLSRFYNAWERYPEW